MLDLLVRAPEWHDEEVDGKFWQDVRRQTGYKRPDRRINLRGLQAFTPASVEEYKSRMVDAMEGESFARVCRFAAKVALVAAVIVAAIVATCWAFGASTRELIAAVALASLPCLIIAIAATGGYYSDQPSYRWRKVSLGRYGEPTPEFVLATAMEAKATFPDCELYVDRLTEHRDPFLVMRVDDVDYYLEVWNEPKYKQQREV